MTVLEATNIAVAAGTLVLALFTWRAATAGRKAARAAELAADATQRAAEASRDGANATKRLADEARVDRELAWRPHLGLAVATPGEVPCSGAPVSVQVTLDNVGNGPALSAAVWIYHYDRDGSGWGQFDGLLVSSNQTLPPLGIQLAFPGQDPPTFPQGMFDPPDGRPHRSKWVCVATCTDVLGNWWRFVDGHPAERVRPDEPDPPTWIQWVL